MLDVGVSEAKSKVVASSPMSIFSSQSLGKTTNELGNPGSDL